jgi:hypothetical protein
LKDEDETKIIYKKTMDKGIQFDLLIPLCLYPQRYVETVAFP